MQQTFTVIAGGITYLALLWQSAWEQGDGDHKIIDLSEVDRPALAALYEDTTFLPSLDLDEIGPLLQ